MDSVKYLGERVQKKKDPVIIKFEHTYNKGVFLWVVYHI